MRCPIYPSHIRSPSTNGLISKKCSPMLSHSLIKLASETLDNADSHDPDAAHLRHASRAAYYAMFHALRESSVDTLIPDISAEAQSQVYARVYRALNHPIFKIAQNIEFRTLFGRNEIDDFMTLGAELKGKRDIADYSPGYFPLKIYIQSDISQAEAAIAKFQRARR